jgi:hypothetical protein
METSNTPENTTAQGSSGRRILYCHCAYARVVDEEVKAEVLEGLARSGVAFDAVPDLCELAARRDPSLARLAANEGTELVACYPRAVRWLFHAAEAPLPAEGVTIHNMREEAPDQILKRVLGDRVLGNDIPNHVKQENAA